MNTEQVLEWQKTNWKISTISVTAALFGQNLFEMLFKTEAVWVGWFYRFILNYYTVLWLQHKRHASYLSQINYNNKPKCADE